MRWYLPSTNGDFRLVEADDGSSCVLEVIDPTAHEQELIAKFIKQAQRKKWLGDDVKRLEHPHRSAASYKLALDATMAQAGPALVKVARPKDQTLTAVAFKDGRIETCEGAQSEALEKLADKATGKNGGKAAASVKRGTPCCPQCLPGAIKPATEVLLDFLTPRQHEDWAERRAIVVRGGLSGNRYVIAHRHSEIAQRFGKIAYDADDEVVMHFHDWSIPPEEEVLGAKLILEHREHWLRNEATYFGSGERYKNPFGNVTDGMEDASLMRHLGQMAANLFDIDLTRERYERMPFSLNGSYDAIVCEDPETQWINSELEWINSGAYGPSADTVGISFSDV